MLSVLLGTPEAAARSLGNVNKKRLHVSLGFSQSFSQIYSYRHINNRDLAYILTIVQTL